MISDVFRKFIDTHEKGLGIIELPTSIGKTFSTFECIAKYAEDWSLAKGREKSKFRQIIVVTPLKKNLQNGRQKDQQDGKEVLRGLEKAYESLDRLDKYNEEVLYLDSMTEIIKGNIRLLSGADDRVPDYIRDLDVFDKLGKKAAQLASSEIIEKDADLYVDIVKRANKFYFGLRKAIVLAYKAKMELPKKKRITLTEIADTEGYTWIFELFPDLLIKRRKILLMSFKKLLDGRVYEKPSYAFLSKKFLEKNIVFIDEFDSTKMTIKDSLAEEQAENRVDFLQLFANIYSGVKNPWSAEYFAEIDRQLNLEDKHFSMEQVLKRAESRRLSYLLDRSFKTSGELRDDNHAFIFRDSTTSTIGRATRNVQVMARETSGGSVDIVLCSSEERRPNDFYLESVINWVTGFLKYFSRYVMRISTAYVNNSSRGSMDSDEEEITFEDAFRTYLYKYGISRDEMVPNPQTKLLLTMADSSTLKNGGDEDEIRQKYSYYINGFAYYSMDDAIHHDDNTIVYMVNVSSTAESIMAKICKNALVMGMSATASIPSVTGNYNLRWLKENLDDYHDVVDTYPELQEEVTAFLEKRYEPYRTGKVAVNTHVMVNDKVAANDENLYRKPEGGPCPALAEYSERTAIKIEDRIKSSLLHVKEDARNYCTLKYYNLFKVMYDFGKRLHMQSLLYLGSKMADGTSLGDSPTGLHTFDKWVIDRLVKAVNYELGLQGADAIGVGYVYSKCFDADMIRIRSRLSDKDALGNPKDPERLIIISAYASVGVGQNLQYPAPRKYLNVLERLVPRGRADETAYLEKDIDGIYLGDITNLVTNFGSERIEEKDVIMSIFQAEELSANGEIMPETKYSVIKKAFNHLGESYQSKNDLRECQSIRSERTRHVIQAVGRIGRSNQRCREINIYIDSSVFYNLDRETLDRRFMSPEMKAITGAFDEAGTYYLEEDEMRILNKAAEISDLTANQVNGRRFAAQRVGFWDVPVMEWWEEMRDMVLRYPTATEDDHNRHSFINSHYISRGGQPVNNYLFSVNNSYYNHQRVWFGDEESFRRADRKHKPYNREIMMMSEENAGLARIFKYPGLHEKWLSLGYADHFEPNAYIMSPFLYTEIYKGALGEVAGSIILNCETGLHAKKITDPEKFEKADFEIEERPGEYIDFKHYNVTTMKDAKEEHQRILSKLEGIGGNRMYVMNILKRGGKDVKERSMVFYDGKLIVIPWMIDDNGKANSEIKRIMLAL